MLELYYYRSSTCSQKVQLVLHEKGLGFVPRPIDLPRREHLEPAYLAMNPNGVVPTLTHDGAIIRDSSVIMEYLDEAFPNPGLSGRSALERARVREWLRFFEEVPTVAVRIPSFKQVLLGRLRGKTPADWQADSDTRPLRRDFYRSMEHGISEARQEDALRRLRLTADRMERRLATRDWLVGDGFTLADACIIPTFDRLEDLGHAAIWSDLPGVRAWWKRVRQRDSFLQTYVPGVRLVADAPLGA